MWYYTSFRCRIFGQTPQNEDLSDLCLAYLRCPLAYNISSLYYLYGAYLYFPRRLHSLSTLFRSCQEIKFFFVYSVQKLLWELDLSSLLFRRLTLKPSDYPIFSPCCKIGICLNIYCAGIRILQISIFYYNPQQFCFLCYQLHILNSLVLLTVIASNIYLLDCKWGEILQFNNWPG